MIHASLTSGSRIYPKLLQYTRLNFRGFKVNAIKEWLGGDWKIIRVSYREGIGFLLLSFLTALFFLKAGASN